MARYIDGFVFPLRREHLDRYQRVAEAVGEIWKEHGALDYVEFAGDDMHREGTRPFAELADSTDDEVIVFGWVTFDSREARDRVNAKIEADPRMADLVAPLMDPSAPIFQAERMAYAGFRPLVPGSDAK